MEIVGEARGLKATVHRFMGRIGKRFTRTRYDGEKWTVWTGRALLLWKLRRGEVDGESLAVVEGETGRSGRGESCCCRG